MENKIGTLTASRRFSPTIFAPSRECHSVQIQLGGDVKATSVVVALEGTINGDDWQELARHTMSSSEIAAGHAMFHVADKTINNARVSLVSMDGGTNPIIEVWYKSGGL